MCEYERTTLCLVLYSTLGSPRSAGGTGNGLNVFKMVQWDGWIVMRAAAWLRLKAWRTVDISARDAAVL